MQVELILFRKEILNCEARNSMQYRSPNATLDSCCGSTYPTLFTIQLNGVPTSFILLLCPPKYAITYVSFSSSASDTMFSRNSLQSVSGSKYPCRTPTLVLNTLLTSLFINTFALHLLLHAFYGVQGIRPDLTRNAAFAW